MTIRPTDINPDPHTVSLTHEAGLTLAKLHQVLSAHQKADMPITVNKMQADAIQQIARYADRIAKHAQTITVLAQRRPRS